MTVIIFIIFIFIIIFFTLRKMIYAQSNTQTVNIRKHSPQIFYPTRKSKQVETKISPIITNKIVTISKIVTKPTLYEETTEPVSYEKTIEPAFIEPVLIEKTNEQAKQTENKNIKHQNSQPSKSKQKLNLNPTIKYKDKVENYPNVTTLLEKKLISEHDKRIYKQAEKLRIEEMERFANEKNKRYLAQREYEKEISRKRRSN